MTFKTIKSVKKKKKWSSLYPGNYVQCIWNIGRHCHKHLTTPPFLEIIKAAVKCSRDVMNLRFTQR